MIFTESTIKISNNVSKMDSTIVLYRGDKNVEIRFTILQSPFKYSNTVATNVIESTNASYGQLVIKTPNDKPPIFSEVSATKEGTVLFTITKEMIDEIEELGVYTFQIRLMDENKQSRVTIPPVENGIEIKEPIAIEDDNTTNVVGLAKANYAVATLSDADIPTFDDNGKYNKTNWNDGDIITNASLNKIEDGIYTTNENVTATKKYVDDGINYDHKQFNNKIVAMNISKHPVSCSTEIYKKPLCDIFPELLNITYNTVFREYNSFKVNMDNFAKEYPTVKSAYNKLNINLYDENDNSIGNSYGNSINGEGLNIIFINITESLRFYAYFDKALVDGSSTTMETKNGYMTIQLLIPKGNNKQEFIDKIKNLKLTLSVFRTDFLNLNNETMYTPTTDYNPATKKYVDDNTVIHPLPIYKMAEAPTMITYTVNIMDLKKLTTYGAIRDINSTKYQRYHFIYPCDDGTNKTIVNTGDDINDTTFRVYHYDNSSTLTFNNVRYSIDYTKHNTSTDVIVTEYIQNYLGIYNTREYTPTEDYNPATKKYVDDNMKTAINDVKGDLGTEELTTTAKNLKGAVNELNTQCKDIVNNKADLQKVKELIVDAQLKGTEIDTSTFIRKSQLNDISLISENMANAEKFLTDKKIITWKDTQTRDNCIDSVAAPGWIVFNEIECNAGDILFLLHGTTKLLGIANVFLGDGTISRVESVSEVSGITIQENEKYIRICYNNDTNKDLNLFQIKKSTSNLDKFDKFGNIPIVTKEEKANINAKLNDLDIEISRLLRTDIEITTTIGLYNTLTKEEQFNDNNKYIKAKISVQGGEVLYIGATNVNNYNFKPYIILDAENNIIASCEDYENNTVLKDLKVEVPVNGCTMCLNSLAENGIRVAKYTKEKIDNIEMQVNKNKNDMSFINSNYENDIKRYKRMQLKHPFKYKTFDKAYITFCFDDGTNDCDKIASIFKEFGYPMCLSLPPDSLNTVCIGLQSASNGFTVNMKVREVANKVIENGGEVLCHSWTPITKDNITNKDLLVETFVTNVKVLRDAGFEVNGIMTAGGTGALDGGLEQGGDILQYWASIEFDYSDRYGFTEDYFYPRMNLGDSLDMNKTRIDDVVNHNKWIVFFGHALQDTGNYTEENLRAILQYCKDRNVTVVTYKHIYNTFK